MSRADLNALLRQLHVELAAERELDADTRRLVAVVLADLARLGATPVPGPAPLTPGGLEALAVRFEAEHPAVAGALRQLADVLGKAGI